MMQDQTNNDPFEDFESAPAEATPDVLRPEPIATDKGFLPTPPHTQENDPFSGFAGAPVGNKETFLDQAPKSAWENFTDSLTTHFSNAVGGLTRQAAGTMDVVKDKSTIQRGDEMGIAGPGEAFSGKPTQQEYDHALGDMAVQKAERERWDSFRSVGTAGKIGAVLGSGVGGLLDPVSAIPIGRVGAGIEAVTKAAGTNEIIGSIAARAGEFGLFGGAADAASQGLDNVAGYQQGFDWQRLMFSTALSAGFGGAMGTATTVIRGLKGNLPNQAAPKPERVEPTFDAPKAEEKAENDTGAPPLTIHPQERPTEPVQPEVAPEASTQPATPETPPEATASHPEATPETAPPLTIHSPAAEETGGFWGPGGKDAWIQESRPEAFTPDYDAHIADLNTRFPPALEKLGSPEFNDAYMDRQFQAAREQERIDKESGSEDRMDGIRYPDEALPDFWKELRRKAGDLNDTHPEDVASTMRQAMRELPKDPNPASWSTEQKINLIVVQKSLEAFQHQGVPEEKALKMALAAGANRDGRDAEELFRGDYQRFLDLKGEGGRPAGEPVAAAPALPAPEVPATPETPRPLTIRPKRTAPVKDRGVTDFLSRVGGLKDDPELRAVLGGKNPFIPGVGPLIRKNGGMSLDDALRTLTDEGYIFDPGEHSFGEVQNDWRQVIDLIDKEARGDKHLRLGSEENRIPLDEDMERFRLHDETQAEMIKAGIDPTHIDPETMMRVNDMIYRGEETDPLVALEKAIMEKSEQFEEAHDHRTESTGHIPGWDIPFDADAASGAGHETAWHEGETSGAGSRVGEPSAATRHDGAGHRNYEPGADNLPQQLIPDVRPVTDADRIRLEAERPMRGGNREMAADGLFGDSHMQDELFLRGGGKKPIGPDAEGRRFSNRAQLPGEAATVIGPRAGVSDVEARGLKINQSMKRIAEQLGRRLETDGRMSRNALGTYKPKEGVLRIKHVGDIETFSHELGHAIDGVLARDPVTAADWVHLQQANAAELLPMDYNSGITGNPPTLVEGTAEFLRTYITNPAYAAREAPNTAEMFRNILEKSPKVRQAIEDTAKLSQIDSGLNPRQVYRAQIAEAPTMGLEEVSQAFRRYGIVPTIRDYAYRLYQGLIRESAAFDRMSQRFRDLAYENTGKPQAEIQTSEDPDHLFRQLPGAAASAADIIDRGVPLDLQDPFRSARSPSLNQAFSRAFNGAMSRLENERDPLVMDFAAYVTARRAQGEWSLFKAGQLRNQPVRASESETARAVQEFEAQHPQFKEAADDLFAFQRSYLQRRVDKGQIKQETANAFLAVRQDHIPFYRDFGDEKVGSGGGGSSFGSLEHPTDKRFGGSTRDIKNPLRSIIEDVARSERRIAHNDTLVALDNLARQSGELAGPYWEHVPNHEVRAQTIQLQEALSAAFKAQGMSPQEIEIAISNMSPMVGEDTTATLFKREPTTTRNERVLFFYKGGERQAVKVGDNEISKHFYDLMTSMSEPEKDWFMKMTGAVNSGFVSAILHAPRFLLGTLLRDNMTRMFIPRYGGFMNRVLLGQDITGIYTMLADRSFYKAYGAAGGIRGGIYTHAAGELGQDALKAAASTSGFATTTLDEIAAAGTLAGKASIIAHIPFEAVGSMEHYAGDLWRRIKYRDGWMAKGYAALTTPTKVIGDVLRLAELGETASRVGGAKLTYNYLIKQGLTPADAFARAIYESRDVLNYSSGGQSLHQLTRMLPFLQSGINGADRSARGLVGEPIMAALRAYERGGYQNLDKADKDIIAAAWKNWTYIAAAAGVGGALYYPWAKDTNFYKRSSDYMKRTYYLIQTGEDADGNPVGLTIHKGYDIPSAIQTAAEHFSEEMHKADPVNWMHVMSALKETIPRQFRSFSDFLASAPGVKTAYEVESGMKFGMEGAPPRPIVPDALKGLPIEKQVSATTWGVAKMLGKTFGVSPMVVDHVIQSMGGTAGQDIRDLSASVFDNNPLTPTSSALNRFFFGQVYRTSKNDIGAGHDLSDLMARDHGEYQQQAKGYRDDLESGDQAAADLRYNQGDDTAKTFMTLQSDSKFTPEIRDLHPLERSQKIADTVYSMMRNIPQHQIAVQDRSHKKGEEKKVIVMSDDQSRKVYAQLNGLLSEETRNGLTIAGHPGYEGFPVIDTQGRMDAIREIDPEVADELTKRFKQAHILPVQGVAAVWPEVQKRLLADQRAARLGDLVAKAKSHQP